MKTNLNTFPKPSFPVSAMTSEELLDHILKLVHWKTDFEKELKEILIQCKQDPIFRGERAIIKEILGQ